MQQKWEADEAKRLQAEEVERKRKQAAEEQAKKEHEEAKRQEELAKQAELEKGKRKARTNKKGEEVPTTQQVPPTVEAVPVKEPEPEFKRVSEEFATTELARWRGVEDAYLRVTKGSFRIIREERRSIMNYLSKSKERYTQFLNRADQMQQVR